MEDVPEDERFAVQRNGGVGSMITCLPKELIFMAAVFVCLHTLWNIPKDISTIGRLIQRKAPKRELVSSLIATALFWGITAFVLWIFLTEIFD